jgi:formate hydrogenlyase subunit 6/NADH:ubiquinone oxidoreductase subunit I
MNAVLASHPRGMGLTFRRFFQPKATIRYPEARADVAVKF